MKKKVQKKLRRNKRNRKREIRELLRQVFGYRAGVENLKRCTQKYVRIRSAEEAEEIFGRGCVHITGNLYRTRRDQ